MGDLEFYFLLSYLVDRLGQNPVVYMEECMQFHPLHNRVGIKRIDAEEKPAGGIIIPDTAKEKPQEGIVRVLGTGKLDDEGKRIPFEVKVGDRVLVSKYVGTEIKIDGKEYKIFTGDDLVAILS